MKKPVLYIRKFLNKRGYETSAHIIIDVYRDTQQDRRGRDVERVWANCKIAACEDSINLDFSFNKRNRENAIHKAWVVCDSFARLAQTLEAERDRLNEIEDTT